MAEVPKGPGQAETIGALDAKRAANVPGLYRDPASGKHLAVEHPAGADALVRMGFELVQEGQGIDPKSYTEDGLVGAPATSDSEEDKSNKKG